MVVVPIGCTYGSMELSSIIDGFIHCFSGGSDLYLMGFIHYGVCIVLYSMYMGGGLVSYELTNYSFIMYVFGSLLWLCYISILVFKLPFSWCFLWFINIYTLFHLFKCVYEPTYCIIWVGINIFIIHITVIV